MQLVVYDFAQKGEAVLFSACLVYFFQLLLKLSFLGKAVNILICVTCPVFYDYVVTIRLHYPAKNEMLVYQMRLLPYESSVVKT